MSSLCHLLLLNCKVRQNANRHPGQHLLSSSIPILPTFPPNDHQASSKRKSPSPGSSSQFYADYSAARRRREVRLASEEAEFHALSDGVSGVWMRHLLTSLSTKNPQLTNFANLRSIDMQYAPKVCSCHADYGDVNHLKIR